jgi:hypothetical protein
MCQQRKYRSHVFCAINLIGAIRPTDIFSIMFFTFSAAVAPIRMCSQVAVARPPPRS